MSIAASERRWDGQNFAGSVKFAIYIDIQADEPNHWRQREDDRGRHYYECLITPRPGTRSRGEKKFILRCELDARFFCCDFCSISNKTSCFESIFQQTVDRIFQLKFPFSVAVINPFSLSTNVIRRFLSNGKREGLNKEYRASEGGMMNNGHDYQNN